MKYILAVSGGIDSVVLLDRAVKNSIPGLNLSKDNLIVAHFDHGIRPESADDAQFVRDLAKKYDIEFISEKAKLGNSASEMTARKARYGFLRKQISKFGENSKIVTAHHGDDLVETIVMNLARGTSWRGLAPFWSEDIIRPLISMCKAEIVRYAIEHDLSWVEDDSNHSPKYFRNRVRDIVVRTSVSQQKELIKLYKKQSQVRHEIETILLELSLQKDTLEAKQFLKLPDQVSIELLRQWTNKKLTTPQLIRLLDFINNAKSGDFCQPGGKMQFRLYRGKMTFTNLSMLKR